MLKNKKLKYFIIAGLVLTLSISIPTVLYTKFQNKDYFFKSNVKQIDYKENTSNQYKQFIENNTFETKDKHYISSFHFKNNDSFLLSNLYDLDRKINNKILNKLNEINIDLSWEKLDHFDYPYYLKIIANRISTTALKEYFKYFDKLWDANKSVFKVYDNDEINFAYTIGVFNVFLHISIRWIYPKI
ncbi:hypothetical protein GE118_03995 [Mycoplasma sp. NEAQ87857]|uniref:hypothetical protein n=1 Tax=Mycoplasma sp. NEAQ87857 TaxID=2683967 RepID=UPI0013162D16|nr:hypothetical protein [Mycoplasma sp. NEAQ87857]QGZ97938.1 hypothetical protein GE118_03995 [Mycoplasma sp. NEAQ87857]